MKLLHTIKINDDDISAIEGAVLLGIKVNEFVTFDDLTKLKSFEALAKKEPKYKELLKLFDEGDIKNFESKIGAFKDLLKKEELTIEDAKLKKQYTLVCQLPRDNFKL